MPKITVHGGPSIWDGTNSSTSSSKPEKTQEKTNNHQVPAPTTESHSEKDQETSYSASPTDGNGLEMPDEIKHLLGEL